MIIDSVDRELLNEAAAVCERYSRVSGYEYQPGCYVAPGTRYEFSKHQTYNRSLFNDLDKGIVYRLLVCMV